jgi:hypothetical protein
LGLQDLDVAIDRVAQCGGGSSFDGVSFDGCAADMLLFDRWRHYAHDPSFRGLFDRQAVDLCLGLDPNAPLGNAYEHFGFDK